jgi:MraZ protein
LITHIFPWYPIITQTRLTLSHFVSQQRLFVQNTTQSIVFAEVFLSLFLSSYTNRVDKKGRVSVPAAFRAALGVEASGIMVFRSLHQEALDACSPQHLERLSANLETLQLAPDLFEMIETTIFGGAQFLPFDSEGRIGLPESLTAAAAIGEQVTFVGLRTRFQLWQPERYEHHAEAMRQAARSQDISLSTMMARSARTAPEAS